jgi:hypothetical protein
MTLLTVVQDVCPFIGVEVPQSVFSGIAADRTLQELLALANEMARRIATDNRDWTRLKYLGQFTGDGVNHLFALPADYLRFPITSNMWRSTDTQAPMRFIPNVDEWTKRRLANEVDSRGEWSIFGGKVAIWPVMPVGTIARIVYISKNCIQVASPPNTFSDRFINDGDSFVLDERLLKLGMIWQWKAQKGSPYAEDMGSYQDAIMLAMGFDSPAPTIIGNLPVSANARVAYPWPVPS